MYKLPVGYQPYSLQGDQSMFIYTGHTSAAPVMTNFYRHASRLVNGTMTVPSMRVLSLTGLLDADQKPVATRITVDTTVRWPAGATKAAILAAVARQVAILGDAEFQDDAFEEQLLPREAKTS